MSLQVLSGKTDLKKISGGTVVVLPVQKEASGIVTVGFSANPESGVQVTIPEKNGAHTIDDLKKSYEKCFQEFSRLSGGSQARCDGKLFFPVLGTGEPGWTEQESLDAAWTIAMKFFDMADRFQNYDVLFWCKNRSLAEEYNKRKSRAFCFSQGSWGARGDLFYWKYLMKHFDNPTYNDLDLPGFIREINQITMKLCGCGVSEDLNTYVESFDHGGMSGGHISGFWATRGIPVLCSRLCSMGLDGMKKKHMVRVSVRKSKYSETDPLMLPKEILPELQSLLTQSTLEISHWKWRRKRG